MGILKYITSRYRGNGFNAKKLILSDDEIVACFTCRKIHSLRGNNADHDYADFTCRHPIEDGHIVLRMTQTHLKAVIDREQNCRIKNHELIKGFTHNASVLEAFQSSDQSIDLTSFNSLAASATAGWSSHWIDNSSNLYIDDIAYIKIAAVNTAPANNKAFYIYGASNINTTDLPSTGAASGNTVANSSTTSATLTFPSIATPLACVLPTVRIIPYPVQNAANTTSIVSLARAFGGYLGLYFWYAMLNYSGMTIAASGNVFKRRGVYNTVA